MNSADALSLALSPLGVLYGLIGEARAWAYASGLLEVRSLPGPVISVGNLSAGGTGKTPLVHAILRALERDFRCAVLTRGYGRENPRAQAVSWPAGGFSTPWRHAGDEPALLSMLHPETPVIANACRYDGGRWIVRRTPVDCFLLDDGFQRQQLRRECNIVLLPGASPLENGRCLPAGLLREFPRQLRRATCIVVRGDQEQYDLACELLRGILPFPLPIFRMELAEQRLVPLAAYVEGDLAETAPAPRGSVVMLCAIARPAGFRESIYAQGLRIAAEAIHRDHHSYADEDLGACMRKVEAHRAEAVVTTGKDAVKLAGRWPSGVPCLALHQQHRILDANGDEEPFRLFLRRTAGRS